MKPEHELTTINISKKAEIFRPPIKKLISSFMPSEIEGKENLEHTKKLIKDGYGVVIFFDHFSLRDPIQPVLDIITANPSMKNLRILAPIAEHHYRYSKFVLGPLGYLTEIKTVPTITPNTLERAVNNPNIESGLKIKQRKFTDNYKRKMLEYLSTGGIVLFAPQIKREEKLVVPKEEESKRPITHLIANLKRNKIEKVAFLIVGIGIKNAIDYSKNKVGKYNLKKIYTVNIGSTLTLNEILDRTQGDLRTKIRASDRIILEELGKVVPPAYNKLNKNSDK